MVSETGPRVVGSNFFKGPNHTGTGSKRAKEPNKNFGASKCYLGPNFWNLAPKGPTWQPWLPPRTIAPPRTTASQDNCHSGPGLIDLNYLVEISDLNHDW